MVSSLEIYQGYVEAILVEAAHYKGYKVNAQSLPTQPLRPYMIEWSITKIHPGDQGVVKKLSIYFKYFTALSLRQQLKHASETLKILEEHQNNALGLFAQHALLRQINNPIAQISQQITALYHDVKILDSLNKNKVNNYSNCILIATIGGVVLSVGSYASAPWLVTAGKLALVGSFLLLGFTFYSHWNDEQTIHALYDKVGPECEKIRFHLRHYDQNMHLKFNPIEKYTALVPQFEIKDYNPPAPEQTICSHITYLIPFVKNKFIN